MESHYHLQHHGRHHSHSSFTVEDDDHGHQETHHHPYLPPPPPRCRRRINATQFQTLSGIFAITECPDRETRNRLALELNLSPREVRVWFQNRRAKMRRDRLNNRHHNEQADTSILQEASNTSFAPSSSSSSRSLPTTPLNLLSHQQLTPPSNQNLRVPMSDPCHNITNASLHRNYPYHCPLPQNSSSFVEPNFQRHHRNLHAGPPPTLDVYNSQIMNIHHQTADPVEGCICPNCRHHLSMLHPPQSRQRPLSGSYSSSPSSSSPASPVSPTTSPSSPVTPQHLYPSHARTIQPLPTPPRSISSNHQSNYKYGASHVVVPHSSFVRPRSNSLVIPQLPPPKPSPHPPSQPDQSVYPSTRRISLVQPSGTSTETATPQSLSGIPVSQLQSPPPYSVPEAESLSLANMTPERYISSSGDSDRPSPVITRTSASPSIQRSSPTAREASLSPQSSSGQERNKFSQPLTTSYLNNTPSPQMTKLTMVSPRGSPVTRSSTTETAIATASLTLARPRPRPRTTGSPRSYSLSIRSSDDSKSRSAASLSSSAASTARTVSSSSSLSAMTYSIDELFMENHRSASNLIYQKYSSVRDGDERMGDDEKYGNETEHQLTPSRPTSSNSASTSSSIYRHNIYRAGTPSLLLQLSQPRIHQSSSTSLNSSAAISSLTLPPLSTVMTDLENLPPFSRRLAPLRNNNNSDTFDG